MSEVKLLLQGLSIPSPPLAAKELLPQSLELEKAPVATTSFVKHQVPTPPSNLTCSIAGDPDVVFAERVQSIPSNGMVIQSNCKYKINQYKANWYWQYTILKKQQV